MLPPESKLIYSNRQIVSALDRLAEQINSQLAGQQPVVLCVMQGGLIFSGQLIPRLNCQLEIDYIHATRYSNGMVGADVCWKAEPVTNLKGRTVLVMDDILDEGLTLKAIIQYCHQHGAAQVYSAVLLHKRHDRGDPSIRADFVALDVEDRYVFGFGMDMKGHYRQLDAIYAIEENA